MSKVDPDKPLREQTRIFEIAGRRFEIPIMYIDGRPKPGEHQASMLLEVIWPEMRSIWELENRAEYDRIRKEERRLGWILLEPSSNRPPLSQQIENRERLLSKKEAIGSHEGLEVFLYYYGPAGDPEPWGEIYIEKDADGRVVSFIECSPPNRGPYPICEHKFIDAGLIFKITYHKATAFYEWRMQRERAIEFIQSFEISSENISNKDGK